MKGVEHEQVWLTSALTEQDVLNALTLYFSLRKVSTSRKIGVIISPQLSRELRETLEDCFDFVVSLQEDRNVVGLKNSDFAKLFGFTLKQFRMCVMLAPNLLVLKNCDELFEWAESNSELAVWTKQHDMSIIAFQPSLQEFYRLLDKAANSKMESSNILHSLFGNRTRTGKFIDEKYNRSWLAPSDMLLENGKDISIVNLPKEFGHQVEVQPLGVVAQLVMDHWKKIQGEDVQPLLGALKNPTMRLNGINSRFEKDGIAIIGMSCRYPGANNLEEFWEILLQGKDATGEPPAFRWLKDQSITSAKSGYRNTRAGFLKCPVDEFDAKFFGLSPKEMSCLDPQHRLLHELVWEGLEDAAINPQSLEGTNGSVFMGSWTHDYKDIVARSGTEDFYREYMGDSIGAGAARISHLLGLTGPSIATESGCSSAMVAAHLACKSLERRETNLALVCGVNLLFRPFDKELMPMVVSPDGRCKTFDAEANGFARAEGAGVLVLKRVSDALRDGDKIWGLIKGSGMTQEGVSKSMGTPTVQTESVAMTLALEDADLEPARVSYVETHGTGTIVGDPLEVAAIAKAYHSKERKEPLLIGSVKTNVGHTESCSGITGIMKVVLALQNEIIPAHRNFERLNPAIDLDAVPAKIPLQPVKWPKQKGVPRLAGVSSFGITGTDAHVIIQEPPTPSPTVLACGSMERPLHVLKITAKTDEALEILLNKYKTHLTQTSSDFKDIAYTANIGRADFSQRVVLVAKSKVDAVKILEHNKFMRGNQQLENTGKTCFLFTGQGSQYPGMGKELYETSPVFRMHFEYCEKILKNSYNIDITQVLWSKAKSAEVSRTIYSQTSIFCVEYALLKLWESWGVKPDYALGHSLGEFAAAVCAGILAVEDALKLVAERSRLIDELPRGKMLVIKTDKERVIKLIQEFIATNVNHHLDIAALNSAEQTVVAGDSELILNFGEHCKKAGLKCLVLEATHAFHSKHMNPMLDEYRIIAKTVKNMGGNDCKYISGMRGSLVEVSKIDAEYWVDHTREKVSFLNASKKAVELGCRTFIEIGPQPILSALMMRNNDETPLVCFSSLKRNEGSWNTLLNSLAQLYGKGTKIDWEGFEKCYNRSKVSLPHYPFIGKQYWPDMVTESGVSIHPLLGSVFPNASSTKLFQAGFNLNALEFVKDHAIGDKVIFPGAGYLEMCLAAGVAAVEGSTDALPSPTRAMKVENLTIEAPLSLVDSKTCKMQTVVELNTSNEGQGDWNDMKVSIFRRVESESGKWMPHAKASFCPVPSAEEKEVQFDISQFEKTLQLPSKEAEVTQFYDKLASVGLKFGPMFRSVEKIWRKNNNSNTLLAKVKVPPNDGIVQFIIHPVVLDAMIQATMMLRHASNIKKKLYVPIKIGKFLWLRKMDSSKEIYIYVNNGSALLVDSSGAVLAQMSSIELTDTTVKALESVLEQQTISMPDMWEEVWKPEVGPLQHVVDLKFGAGAKFYTEEFESLMKSYNNPSPELVETFGEAEELVYLEILRAFYKCGWRPELGQVLEKDVLLKQLRVQPDLDNYFRFMLETLEAEGILLPVNTGKSWKVARIPPTLVQVTTLITSPKFSVGLVPKFKPALMLLKMGENLSSILQGEQSALRLLFPPENSGAPSMKDFYNDYHTTFLLWESFCVAHKQRLAQFRDGMKGTRFILRCLEIGSGTGTYSAHFLKCLEQEGIEFEYTYTDISAAFFPAAQKRFEKYGKQIIFKKLNIEEDPIDQGFTPEYYDFVYMAEVIHATRDIRESLRNIRMLMKPQARMDMHEGTRENRMVTYVVGALEGYWRYEDFDIRTRHCLISPQMWAQVFEESGFKVDHILPVLNNYHSHFWVHKTEAQFELKKATKTWLLFHSEDDHVSTYLRRRIGEATTRNVMSVMGGHTFEMTGGAEPTFQIRKEVEEDYVAVFESLKADEVDLEGIIYCWALNRKGEASNQEDILRPFFYLTKSLLNAGLRCCPRLIGLTHGVVPVGSTNLSSFGLSTIWGFAKTLKNENTELGVKMVDVEDANLTGVQLEEIFQELWKSDKETMVAYREGTRYYPKFTQHKPNLNPLKIPVGVDRFQLVLSSSNSISELQFGPLEASKLGATSVEIEMKAFALNFKDVLNIIKPSEEFRDATTVGIDFVGVVNRVGADVTKWKINERVFGSILNNHSLALPSHAQVGQDTVLRVPVEMTMCEAATLPLVYVTGIKCLLEVAKMRKGDVVLIHTATGGVGLSAIELCKFVGSTIIATAGSKRKQNYLRSLDIQHIFHSRNTQYGDQILELTSGRGVDVVLNSLTSEGFKEATLKACGKGARFVEMSKLNVWSEEEVKELRPDVQYTIVDISTEDEPEKIRLVGELEKLMVETGAVKPIPYVSFDALNIRQALGYLQKAKQIGKIVCQMPELRKERGESQVWTRMFQESSSYLITGGLGGIGFVVCQWMVEKGAKHVIVAGRSPPSSSTQTKISEMNSKGANVIPVQLDIGNFEECRKLLHSRIGEMGMPPLRGVMHAAGTLSDGLIVNQTWPKLSSTFNTKVQGTLNLHELTKHLNLEHFVMFSSIAAMFGSPGQSNHAAGNSFEDAFIHYRHSIGLPGTTLNWGQWGEVGIATEVDIPGIKAISNLQGRPVTMGERGGTFAPGRTARRQEKAGLLSIKCSKNRKIPRFLQIILMQSYAYKPDEKFRFHVTGLLQGIAGLEYALNAQLTQLTVVNVDSFQIMSKLYPHFSVYLDERTWKSTSSTPSVTFKKTDEFWEEFESKADVEQKLGLLKGELKRILRTVLILDENEPINDQANFDEMGVDSLMFVEIKNHLQALLGARVTISASALKDCNAVEPLAQTLADLIEGNTQLETTQRPPTLQQVNELIREDCVLSQHIRAQPSQRVTSLPKIRTVFLTGCTGTLGPYLLRELTKMSQITQVICLIRERRNETVAQRLTKLLEDKGLLSQVNMEKVQVVSGNVTAPHLGMGLDVWERLSERVDAIFNSSARITHTELYRKTRSTVDTRAVNVGGMKNLLEFAVAGNLKYFCHASSLMGVVTTDEEGKLSEEWPEKGDFDSVTKYAYPVSKFVCDVLAKEAVERGIPVKAFRLPFIQGEEETGRCEPQSNHVLLRYIFIMKSGCMPGTPLPMPALPVDICADVCVRLFFDERAPSDIYNITSANPDVDQSFVHVAKQFGYDLEVVEFSQFIQRVKEGGEDTALKPFQELYNDGEALMAFLANQSIIKWVEGNEVYRNKKVATFIPNFYENQRPTMDYIRKDLMFLKENGWFDKFNL